MKMEAWGYAHILIKTEFNVQEGQDEKKVAMHALNQKAQEQYGIYPSQFEFSDGIECYEIEGN